MIGNAKKNLGLVLQKNSAPLKLLPQIQENEVHLWCLPLELDEYQHNIGLSLLNDNQRNKYERRKTAALKASYLAGRYYLWHLLSGYSGQPINQLGLSYNHLKKPSLQSNPQRLEFNFTDTFINNDHAIGIYAFGLDKALGVDLESLNRKGDFQRVSKRRFSEAEQAYINSSPEHQNHRFLKLWTRKEAYGKAKGVGINFAMQKLDLFSDSHNLAFKCDQQRDWQLLQISPNQSTIACVVREGETPFSCRFFTQFSK